MRLRENDAEKRKVSVRNRETVQKTKDVVKSSTDWLNEQTKKFDSNLKFVFSVVVRSVSTQKCKTQWRPDCRRIDNKSFRFVEVGRCSSFLRQNKSDKNRWETNLFRANRSAKINFDRRRLWATDRRVKIENSKRKPVWNVVWRKKTI